MGSLDSGHGAGVVGRGADLQDGVLGAAVVTPAQMHRHGVRRSGNGLGHGAGGGCLGAQLSADRIGKIVEVPRTLEVAPRQEILRATAPCGGVAVGGKVQAQRVQGRGAAGFKRLPVARHQALALLVLDHQRFGCVLPGQVRLGKAGVGKDLYVGAYGQIVQCADGVRGGAVPPVLPVQQGDGLAAAQAQCAGERVNKHLIAKAPGQFGVDHARAPNLSYSCSMRRAAVFSS